MLPDRNTAQRLGRKGLEDTDPALVMRVINGIRMVNKKGGNFIHRDSSFYEIVGGGDVRTVEKVLEALSSSDLRPERNLVLFPSGCEPGHQHTGRKTVTSSIIQMCILCLCVVLFILTSPVFYVIHAICFRIWEAFFKRDGGQLPLTIAAMSESKEMIGLFFKQQVSLRDVDNIGNNIFHQLVNLSSQDSEKAVRVFDIVIEFLKNDHRTFRLALTKQTNLLGVSALEYAAREASIDLFIRMLDTEGGMKATVMTVSRGATWMAQQSLDTLDQQVMARQQSPDEDIRFRLCRYDVTRFEECGLMTDYSLLLQQYLRRDFENVTKDDLETMNKCKFITGWTAAKISINTIPTAVRSIIKMAQALLAVYFLIIIGGTMDIKPMAVFYLTALREKISNNETCAGEFVVEDVTLTSCQFEVFKQLKKRCPPRLESIDLLRAAGLSKPITSIRMVQVVWTLSAATFLFEALGDIIKRLLFLIKTYDPSDLSSTAFLHRLLYKKVPGSYIADSINMLSVWLFVWFSLDLYVYLEAKGQANESMEGLKGFLRVRSHKLDRLQILIMSSLIVRFVGVLFHVRLLPAIGHYVITTFCMARHLAASLVVYSFVMFVFGLIFHLLIVDPECPAVRNPDFRTFADGVFQASKLMYGHGDFYYGLDITVKLAYVIYCVLTVLLLLNLTIAVMSTSAATNMVSPWKDALRRAELLEEALDSEFKMRIITRPWRWRYQKYTMAKIPAYVISKTPVRKIHFEVGLGK